MSEQIRSDVWNSSLYYGTQFEKFESIKTKVEWVLFISGSVGLVALAGQWIPLLPPICIAVSSMAALYSRVGQHSRKAACLYFIRCDCQAVEQKLESLWSKVQSSLISDNEALDEIQDLKDALRIVTDKASLAGLSFDREINQSSWEEIIETKKAQYATAR